MRDKDQILLENIYNLLNEAQPTMSNPRELIGQVVEIHPAIKGSTDFMKWSVKLDKVVHGAKTLLLKDVHAVLDHEKISKKIRNPELGQKSPIILVKGTVVDVDFPIDKLNQLISQGDWKSVTYNPHKHTEYIYKDKLPDWWNTDERYPHTSNISPSDVKRRTQAMQEREKENFPFNELSKKSSPQDTKSSFNSQYAILKQYSNRGEDYMWVKGVHH